MPYGVGTTNYSVPTTSVKQQGGNAPGGVIPENQKPANAVGGYQTEGFQYGMPSAGGIQTSVKDNSGQDLGYIDPQSMPVSSVGRADPYFRQASDAYYQQAESRLNPQWQNTQADLESKLENMGLSRGSEAWEREMSSMGRSKNDAYNQAQMQSILTGGAEAQRMQGMDIASGNFANNAAQQDFLNKFKSQEGAMALGRFGNEAQAQQFGQNESSARLNNDALKTQQDVAQGWGSLKNQLDLGEMNARASEAGAEAAAAGANAQMAMQTKQMELNQALNMRQQQGAERQQDFNMARQMYYDPIITQNMLMEGQGPQYDPSYANYGLAPPSMGNVNSSGYAEQAGNAANARASGIGSMGGSLLEGLKAF